MKLAPLSSVQPTEIEGGQSASLTSAPGVADLTVSESTDAVMCVGGMTEKIIRRQGRWWTVAAENESTIIRGPFPSERRAREWPDDRSTDASSVIGEHG